MSTDEEVPPEEADAVWVAELTHRATVRYAKEIHQRGRENFIRSQWGLRCMSKEDARRSVLKTASTKTDKSRITLPSVTIRED